MSVKQIAKNGKKHQVLLTIFRYLRCASQ